MKILVIQQKMIGDVLASTILCEHLKLAFQNAEIHFLINENTMAVVEGNPFIDKMVFFEKEFRENKLRFYEFLIYIKKEKYDVVVDVLCKLESNLITIFSRAKIKISYKKWYSKFIYNHVFELSNSKATEVGLAIENRLLLLQPLLGMPENYLLAPKIYLSKKEVLSAKKFLSNHSIDKSKPLMMVGILGSSHDKSYPLPYLAELLDFVCGKYDFTLLFNYVPSQVKEVEKLLECCSERTKTVVRQEVYAHDLRSFLALLAQCDGYFGNEGGQSNMSKALGIPNFSIFCPWMSKKAWLTYPMDTANRAVHLSDFEPGFEKLPKKERKSNVELYYTRFKPELIIPELQSFIEGEVLSNQ